MLDINVKHVVIVGIVFGSIVAVSVLGGDVATIVVVGMALLGGLGLLAAQQASTQKETQIVREQTNGTQTEMVKMIATQQAESAAVQRQLLETMERFSRLLAASNVPAQALAELPAVAPTSPSAPADVTAVLPAVADPPGGYPTQFPNNRAA